MSNWFLSRNWSHLFTFFFFFLTFRHSRQQGSCFYSNRQVDWNLLRAVRNRDRCRLVKSPCFWDLNLREECGARSHLGGVCQCLSSNAVCVHIHMLQVTGFLLLTSQRKITIAYKSLLWLYMLKRSETKSEFTNCGTLFLYRHVTKLVCDFYMYMV